MIDMIKSAPITTHYHYAIGVCSASFVVAIWLREVWRDRHAHIVGLCLLVGSFIGLMGYARFATVKAVDEIRSKTHAAVDTVIAKPMSSDIEILTPSGGYISWTRGIRARLLRIGDGTGSSDDDCHGVGNTIRSRAN